MARVSDERRAPNDYRWARQVAALLLIAVVVVIVVLDVIADEYEVRAPVLVPAAPHVGGSPLGRPAQGTSLMAAYGTDPARYLPPHLPAGDEALGRRRRRLPRLLDPRPRQRRQPRRGDPDAAGPRADDGRARPDRRPDAHTLDDPNAATREQQPGPLPASAAARMVALMWAAYPTLRTDDVDFRRSSRSSSTGTSRSWRATPPTSRDRRR